MQKKQAKVFAGLLSMSLAVSLMTPLQGVSGQAARRKIALSKKSVTMTVGQKKTIRIKNAKGNSMKGGFFPAKTNWEEPDTDMAQDYNATLNLPKTAFPMRGNLPKREPDVLGKWEEQDLYEKMVQKNQGRPMYVFPCSSTSGRY